MIMETSVGVLSAYSATQRFDPQSCKLPRGAEHDAAIDPRSRRISARIHSSWRVAALSATARCTPATR